MANKENNGKGAGKGKPEDVDKSKETGNGSDPIKRDKPSGDQPST